jgi:hypothetical protein
MLAVGSVHAITVHVAVEALKQVPAPPVGVTVIVTLSPPAKPVTWYDNTLPIAPTFTTGLAFTW